MIRTQDGDFGAQVAQVVRVAHGKGVVSDNDQVQVALRSACNHPPLTGISPIQHPQSNSYKQSAYADSKYTDSPTPQFSPQKRNPASTAAVKQHRHQRGHGPQTLDSDTYSSSSSSYYDSEEDKENQIRGSQVGTQTRPIAPKHIRQLPLPSTKSPADKSISFLSQDTAIFTKPHQRAPRKMPTIQSLVSKHTFVAGSSYDDETVYHKQDSSTSMFSQLNRLQQSQKPSTKPKQETKAIQDGKVRYDGRDASVVDDPFFYQSLNEYGLEKEGNQQARRGSLQPNTSKIFKSGAHARPGQRAQLDHETPQTDKRKVLDINKLSGGAPKGSGGGASASTGTEGYRTQIDPSTKCSNFIDQNSSQWDSNRRLGQPNDRVEEVVIEDQQSSKSSQVKLPRPRRNPIKPLKQLASQQMSQTSGQTSSLVTDSSIEDASIESSVQEQAVIVEEEEIESEPTSSSDSEGSQDSENREDFVQRIRDQIVRKSTAAIPEEYHHLFGDQEDKGLFTANKSSSGKKKIRRTITTTNISSSGKKKNQKLSKIKEQSPEHNYSDIEEADPETLGQAGGRGKTTKGKKRGSLLRSQSALAVPTSPSRKQAQTFADLVDDFNSNMASKKQKSKKQKPETVSRVTSTPQLGAERVKTKLQPNSTIHEEASAEEDQGLTSSRRSPVTLETPLKSRRIKSMRHLIEQSASQQSKSRPPTYGENSDAYTFQASVHDVVNGEAGSIMTQSVQSLQTVSSREDENDNHSLVDEGALRSKPPTRKDFVWDETPIPVTPQQVIAREKILIEEQKASEEQLEKQQPMRKVAAPVRQQKRFSLRKPVPKKASRSAQISPQRGLLDNSKDLATEETSVNDPSSNASFLYLKRKPIPDYMRRIPKKTKIIAQPTVPRARVTKIVNKLDTYKAAVPRKQFQDSSLPTNGHHQSQRHSLADEEPLAVKKVPYVSRSVDRGLEPEQARLDQSNSLQALSLVNVTEMGNPVAYEAANKKRHLFNKAALTQHKKNNFMGPLTHGKLPSEIVVVDHLGLPSVAVSDTRRMLQHKINSGRTSSPSFTEYYRATSSQRTDEQPPRYMQDRQPFLKAPSEEVNKPANNSDVFQIIADSVSSIDKLSADFEARIQRLQQSTQAQLDSRKVMRKQLKSRAGVGTRRV